MDELPSVFVTIMKHHELSPGDFPDVNPFIIFLDTIGIIKLPKLNDMRMRKGNTKGLPPLKFGINIFVKNKLVQPS